MDTNNKISETSQAGRDRGADEQGAVTEDPFRITAALLHDWNACSDGIAKFQEHFPEGGSYAEVLDKAYEEKQASYAIWLACAAWDAWIEKPDFVKVETSSGDALVARMNAKIDENVGYASRLAASGDASRLAASGYDSVVAAAGIGATVSLGANGCAAVAYYDGKRFRFALAYVGENVEAGKRYRVNSSGQFEEVV